MTLELVGRLWEIAAVALIVVGFYATWREWRDGDA